VRSWIRSIQRVERVVEGPGLHRIEVWQYCNAEERTERTMTLQSFLAPLCNLSWLKENKANLKLLSLYYNIVYIIYIYDNTCLNIINKYIYIYSLSLHSFVDALLVQSKWPRLQRLVNMAEIPPAVVGLWADIFHPVPRSLRRICEQHVPLWHLVFLASIHKLHVPALIRHCFLHCFHFGSVPRISLESRFYDFELFVVMISTSLFEICVSPAKS
jgi:hypothetical protein